MLTYEETTEIPITESALRACTHPSERSRAVLAIVGVLPFVLVALALVVLSVGVIAIIAVVSMWFAGRIVDAKLRGNAVEVTDRTYPEIAEQVQEIARRLGYSKRVRVFIVQDGEINAMLWRVFGRKYLSLNTGLVHSMSPAERGFVIARFVGALRARHLRFHEASSFIESLEDLRILNVLLLPYFRATVYSGDRIGMISCGSYDTAVHALDKLLLGSDLGTTAPVDGFMSQARELRRSPFRVLSLLFSSHPHMSDRYLELAAFASEQDRSAHLLPGAGDRQRSTAVWASAAALLGLAGLTFGAAHVWDQVSDDSSQSQHLTDTTTIADDEPQPDSETQADDEPVLDSSRPPTLEEIPIPEYGMDPYSVERVIIEEGDGLIEAVQGDTVTFHLASRLSDGTLVTNTWSDGGPLTYMLGDGSLIPGLDEALQGLWAGDRAEIHLGSEQAFGAAGNDNGSIPPDSNLAYLVYVVDVGVGS